MVDSASDSNVEDVLSSVRRLVSQELPKRSSSSSLDDAGALVLSSKDRIEAEHSKRVAAKSLEQRIAELEQAVDKTATEFEPDGSEDQAQHRPDRIVYTRPRSTETAARRRSSTLRLSEIALIETGAHRESKPSDEKEVPSDVPIAFRHAAPRGSGDEAPIAEDVPTIPAGKAEVRAFSDPDDVVARIEARIERGGDAIDPSVSDRALQVDRTADADFDAELTAAVRASIAAGAPKTPQEGMDGSDDTSEGQQGKAPEVETNAVARAETTEVSSREASNASAETASEREVNAPRVVDVAQAAVLTARAKSLKESVVKPSRTERTAEEKAEAALATLADEDAMRLLVGRLIREELKGQLGERITQNVRKLVRSEIKRVLESRVLD